MIVYLKISMEIKILYFKGSHTGLNYFHFHLHVFCVCLEKII